MLEADLCGRARSEAALRLRLGQLLEAVGQGAHHELGFSSLAAYALERCARGVRWVEGARCLARRLEALPEVRGALACGRLLWSMAEPVSRVATAADEAHWLAAAEQLTVRQMCEVVVQRLSEAPSGDAVPDDGCVAGSSGEASDVRTLVVTVDQEDAWLFEATRALLCQLGASTGSDQVEALLAEGQEGLLRAAPRGAIDPERLERRDEAQRRWCEQLAQFRQAAEVRCEAALGVEARTSEPPDASTAECTRTEGPNAERPNAERPRAALPHGKLAALAARGGVAAGGVAPAALDAAVCEVSQALAAHELELSYRLLEFHRADGWRRLGYATEAQYARERLGLSRSAVLAKRALAVRLGQLPRVAEAMRAGELGVEAATQVAAIATKATESQWVERARQRTVKHLKEEVAASLTAVRLSGLRDCPPPLEHEIERFFDLERAVLGGQLGAAQAERSGHAEQAVPTAGPTTESTAPLGASGVGASSVGASSAGSSSAAFGEPAQPGRRPWRVMLGSLGEWLAGAAPLNGVQMSAGRAVADGSMAAGSMAAGSMAARSLKAVGRVRLRLRVAGDLFAWWRGLEEQARRWLPPGVSWLRFLCLSVWRGWQHLMGVSVAYGGIYVRDRHRCSSPVCNRRDVTPHHLRFRSAGGGDEPDNLAAVCSWCHLLGIHERRIVARRIQPPATQPAATQPAAAQAQGASGRVRWELGRGEPCLVVEGRERLAV